MIPRGFNLENETSGLTWADLNLGVPTIVAIAHLSSLALSRPDPPACDLAGLSAEARTILVASKDSGSISIRGNKNAFEPAERFLAVCVDMNEGRRVEFRCVGNPEQTVRFMEGLRQLCNAGLVMHQLMNDFSLTAHGFEMARSLDVNDYQALIDLGTESI
ncbi:MAG TPA: hypothetical protein PKD64_05675 [Pirellulaceae bacterium]|nr:hypothetical protein [Pirellulaceae bacterium]HMO91668.1 hypothetical protein [Pirellulaceae bacterium]HMP68365.1 hypothetical protein [Pirellulaceae bacterium]